MIWGLEKSLDEGRASSVREMTEGREAPLRGCPVGCVLTPPQTASPGGFGAEIPEGNQRSLYKNILSKIAVSLFGFLPSLSGSGVRLPDLGGPGGGAWAGLVRGLSPHPYIPRESWRARGWSGCPASTSTERGQADVPALNVSAGGGKGARGTDRSLVGPVFSTISTSAAPSPLSVCSHAVS